MWAARIALIALLLLSGTAFAECRAILFEGGGDPGQNIEPFGDDISQMYDALVRRGCKPENIYLLSASGNPLSRDFHQFFGPRQVGINTFYLFKPNLRPGTQASLVSTLGEIGRTARPGDELIFFVTDHGSKGGITTWNDGTISLQEMQRDLSALPTHVKVKLVTECCFCGQFNKIKRTGFCSITTTDADHEGMQLIDRLQKNDWIAERINAIAGRTSVGMDIFAQVATGSKTDPSLEQLRERWAVLGGPTQDTSFTDLDLLQCRPGPRSSAEQVIFDSLGFQHGVCLSDLSRLAQFNPSKQNPQACELRDPTLQSVDDFSRVLDVLQARGHSADAKQLITQLGQQTHALAAEIRSDPNYQKLLALNTSFLKLNPRQRLAQGLKYQNLAAPLYSQNKQKYEPEIGSILNPAWDQLLRTVFYNYASTEQIQEYERALVCLNEPLF